MCEKNIFHLFRFTQPVENNTSLLVFQEVAQIMNAILYTMARLKYKVGHENFLFGLKILFSFCWVRVGRGWGYRFRGKKF